MAIVLVVKTEDDHLIFIFYKATCVFFCLPSEMLFPGSRVVS